MTSLLYDIIGRLYPKDQEYSKSFYCQQQILNQLLKRQKYRNMRERHPSVIAVWKFKTEVNKERCKWECNKTIISETFCVFPLVKTSGYHLKAFVLKLTKIYMCRKTLTSVLRQIEQHEQIKIMANHGPLCKRIKNDKEISSNQPCGRDSECKMVRF